MMMVKRFEEESENFSFLLSTTKRETTKRETTKRATKRRARSVVELF